MSYQHNTDACQLSVFISVHCFLVVWDGVMQGIPFLCWMTRKSYAPVRRSHACGGTS